MRGRYWCRLIDIFTQWQFDCLAIKLMLDTDTRYTILSQGKPFNIE